MNVVKRNGVVVPFDGEKVANALRRCFRNEGLPYGEPDVESLTASVINVLTREYGTFDVGVEDVQRIVIQQLWASGRFDAGERYQNYRELHAMMRENEVSPEVAARIAEDQSRFPTDLQYYQFMSKFSRWREEDRRRETWYETCFERVLPWLYKQVPGKLTSEEQGCLESSMYGLEASPAMRVVQMAGPALDRCHVGVYNCAAMPVDDVFSFPEFLYILMQGTGCGFSVESKFVEKLPRIVRWRDLEPQKLVVEDTTEGWCDAFHEALIHWFDGHDVWMDVSGVRPAGARLRTKGGRTSGPGPFLDMIAYARNVFRAHAGRRLTDVAVHRIMCMIGKIVQVGDMRRAATCSLSDLDSTRMRDLKHGRWGSNDPYWRDGKHLSMANNSAVYEEKPTIDEFTREWLALMESKSGERGIFNREALSRLRPQRRADAVWMANPCFEINLRPRQFCVSADTLLLTKQGITRIGRAEGTSVEVWNGKRWNQVTVNLTRRQQQLVRVTFSDGSYLDCTPDHRFSVNTTDSRSRKGPDVWTEVQAKNLVARMATETFVVQHDSGQPMEEPYTLGALVGDGHVDKDNACIVLYGAKIRLPVSGNRGEEVIKPGYKVSSVHVNTGRLHTKRLQRLRSDDEAVWFQLFTYNRASILEFLAGWFDTDGTQSAYGNVRLYVDDRFKANLVQMLFTKCGLCSSVNRAAMRGMTTNYGERKKDLWYVQITECSDMPCKRLDTSGGHKARFRGKFQTVRTVQYLPGLHDVFCFDEPETHKAVFSNTLTHQCNNSIAVARPDDTIESLKRKLWAATVFGVIQATCDKFKYIRDDWRKNCTEERILGVDVTGHADYPLLRFGARGRGELLLHLRSYVNIVRREFCERFGINQSAADTTVKPSGDSAVFFNCASGVSPWFARYRTRWVRQSKKSPVAKLLRDQGVPFADAPEDPSLYVFGFPCEAPAGATLRNDMTAIQQCENWLEWKTCYAEHSVSCTVYVDDHEWLEVGAWVYRNFDRVSGISFLPKDNGSYTYAPNEELTEGQYREAVARFPRIDWSKLPRYEDDDMTESSQTIACHGGKCD